VRIQLFVTCLVDLVYPEVGERTVALLERLGCEVEFPRGQTCCGQPAHNSGFPEAAARVTAAWRAAFADADGPIVAPFGSCARFVGDPRVIDLPTFVVERLGVADAGGRYDGRVVWHQECHLHDGGAGRALLDGVRGCEVVDAARPELCCGFGGTFSVKRPEISVAMADEKLDAALAAGADAIVSTDPGCLMHLEGRARHRGLALRVHHLVDLLEPAGRL
jgi:L-lactate dehydrogenase complex protein LldE